MLRFENFLFLLVISSSTFCAINVEAQFDFDINFKDKKEVLRVDFKNYWLDETNIESKHLQEEGYELYDGSGKVEFRSIKSDQYHQNRNEVWLRNYSEHGEYFDIYDNRDKLYFYRETAVNDSTISIEQKHRYSNDKVQLETYLKRGESYIITFPDSIFIKLYKDDNGNVTKQVLRDKDGKEKISHTEYLKFDPKGNWTSCIKSSTYEDRTFRILLERTIYYKSDYSINKYLKLEVDSLFLNNNYISSPEDLKSSHNKFHSKAISRLFRKRYFNSDYFFYFNIDSVDEKQSLDTRLFNEIKTYIQDIKNNRYFSGLTNDDRWFDKTNTYKQLESMTEAPKPSGKVKTINGLLCKEYLGTNESGQKEKYYVTDKYPFINYFDFTFTLPGLIIKSEKYFKPFGKHELTIKISETKYPFHYLEFLEALEEIDVEVNYLKAK